MRIVTVIGARPQFIKAAAISRAIRTAFSDQVAEVIVHTGQHYDREMSEVFFEQLEIPKENYNLGIGSGSHGVQTAGMIVALEEVLVKEHPDAVILYGDTNSTLAGAVVASKLRIPIIHIEAGMRSFTKEVPEEINRIMCDHVSTLLFTPTMTGAENLYKEGFSNNNPGPYHVDNPKVIPCGDIMYDNSLYFRGKALTNSNVMLQHDLRVGGFVLVTVHRNNNTDDTDRLKRIFESFDRLASISETVMVVPLHPRTRKMLANFEDLNERLTGNPNIKIIPPASYLDMVCLEANAEMIITDSGGVQKEAYYFEKPCLILQSETPWVELVDNGCAELVDADPTRIEAAFYHFRKIKDQLRFPDVFGDGKAAEFTIGQIIKYLG
ncbi:MAG: non-hydrolyzing UDP-N-acetylglucosamine 2-epimerase [Bacteroidota bacterium]